MGDHGGEPRRCGGPRPAQHPAAASGEEISSQWLTLNRFLKIVKTQAGFKSTEGAQFVRITNAFACAPQHAPIDAPAALLGPRDVPPTSAPLLFRRAKRRSTAAARRPRTRTTTRTATTTKRTSRLSSRVRSEQSRLCHLALAKLFDGRKILFLPAPSQPPSLCLYLCACVCV